MKQTPYQFFKQHAGYSYDPNTQTPEQGRRESAKRYAKAEQEARERGYRYEWEIDQDGSSADWLDDNEDGGKNRKPWKVWFCCMWNVEGTTLLASLCGIDFGRNGTPWNEPYRRVVEAELAMEAIAVGN